MQTQEEFMNLDRENMRKIRQLILFTIIILIALWNYAIILDAVGYALGIIFPFILGGGIAFVLNVPMSSIEELIFYNKKLKDKKIANRLARPVSLVLTIVIMIGVVVLVMFVVIPELTRTLMSLGRTIQVFIPEAQRFLEDLFTNNSDMRAWLDSLNLNVDTIMSNAVEFFQTGAGNVLNSTMSAIGSIVSGVTTFVIAFVFACYLLLQKEKLRVQVGKVLDAFLKPERVEWVTEVCSLTAKTFSNCLAGVYSADQCADRLYRTDPYIRRVYRMFRRCFPDPDGGSSAGSGICDYVPCTSADRRKYDLSKGCGKICRSAVYLGTGGGYSGR